ncbi:MAG: PadR family transcriptional regulator [Acidimicrobiia bacterium]|nr:PadR family transcriptional regulator [Acidimicrobiia bacterium]
MPAHEDIQSRWLRGLLEACALAVLQREPAYGYEIANRFEEAGLARPKGGTLYPILSRLEDEGLIDPTWVEGESGPSRKYYRLTKGGLDAVAALGAEWGSFVDRVSKLFHQPDRRAS